MKNNSVIVFAVLVLLVFAFNAQAYPGSKASDLKQTVTLKSVCKDRIELTTTSHFYAFSGAKYGPEGCPRGAIIEAVAYPIAVPSLDVAKEAGVQGFAMIQFDHGILAYKMAYRTQALASTGAIHFKNEIGEMQYDQLEAIGATLSESNPGSATIDFPAREIADFKAKPNRLSQIEMKITSVCREKMGAVRAYTIPQGLAGTEGECPTPYQLSFDRVTTTVNDPYRMYYNQIYDSGVHYRHQHVVEHIEVLSRFGNPLFSHGVSIATVKRAKLDFTTASQEHPVSVWVDTDAKVVLKIKPSISPFAL